MSFNDLPHDILFLLLQTTAENSGLPTLIALASTTPAPRSLYALRTPLLLRVLYKHLQGIPYESALALARQELGQEPSSDVTVAILQKAIITHDDILAFAVYLHERHQKFCATHLEYIVNFKVFFQIIYEYALSGTTYKLFYPAPLSAYAHSIPPSPLDPETSKTTLAYALHQMHQAVRMCVYSLAGKLPVEMANLESATRNWTLSLLELDKAENWRWNARMFRVISDLPPSKAFVVKPIAIGPGTGYTTTNLRGL